jgi:hypothetical protein
MQHATSRALLGLLFDPGKWKRDVPPKPRLAYTGLHGVISQKAQIFLAAAVRTSNSTEK